jgi:hypothetical protein
MNYLPNSINVPAGGANPALVSLIVTETTIRTTTEGNSAANELPLEKAMHRRADAMTDVLTEIMERPTTPRFWGLNE